MNDNRRGNFRASIVEAVTATLFIGRRQVPVQLVEESAGGLSVVTEDTPTFPLETEAELKTDDGRNLRVRVKHYKRRGMWFQLGLQRIETANNDAVDLRQEFSAPITKPVSALWFAGVLLLGLSIGWAVQTESVQRRLMKMPAVKALFNRNPTQDATGSNTFNTSEPYELADWAKKWGVSPAEVLEAVKKVGPMAKDVQKALGK